MKLRSLLKRLKDSRIGELRNQVVHKHAYRPILEEVDGFIEEAQNILFVLDVELSHLTDDVMIYY